MPELHGLFAVCNNGKSYEVGPPTDWTSALNRWYRFDDVRFRGGRKQRIGKGRDNDVRYWAVRSKSDPDTRWSGAIRVRLDDVKVEADSMHTIAHFFNKAWRATAKHSAILTAGGDCVIGYGPNPLVASSDARAQARRRGMI